MASALALIPAADPLGGGGVGASSAPVAPEGGDHFEDEEAPRGCCFPCTFGAIFPPPFSGMVPGYCMYIQDCTHLILVLGSCAMWAMLVVEIAWWVLFTTTKLMSPLELAITVCLGIGVCPNVCYLTRVLTQLDVAVMVREKQIAKEKGALLNQYEGAIKGMDDLLTQAAGTSATLAEANYENNRRDFIKFLTNVEDRMKGMVIMDGDMQELTKQFREYVKNWLRVFSECSIDPINVPKWVASSEELDNCRTVVEICQLTKERLLLCPVQFITQAINKDKAEIQDLRQSKRMRKVRDSVVSIEMTEIKDKKEDSAALAIADPTAGALGGAGAYVAPKKVEMKLETRACNWCQCGQCGCGCKSGDQMEGWPVTSHCLCLKVLIFGPEHIALLWGTLCMVFVIVLEVWTMLPNRFLPPDFKPSEKNDWMENFNLRKAGITALAAQILFSFLTLLTFFEKLDIIQRLEAQITQLKAIREEVDKRKVVMEKFWGEVLASEEIWAYNTTPRLEMYKEVTLCLEDSFMSGDAAKTRMALQNVCQTMEALEGRLPALENWKRGGCITEDQKKSFKEHVEQVFKRSDMDFDRLLDGMLQLTQEGPLHQIVSGMPATALAGAKKKKMIAPSKEQLQAQAEATKAAVASGRVASPDDPW